MRGHRNIRRAALVTLAGSTLGVGVAALAPTASADTECLNVAFPATRLIDWDGVNTKVEYSPAVAVSLPAGRYDLTGSSHDDYPARVGVTQTSEIWELQFLGAGGTVIATSGVTGDLPDRVAVANWSGSLGTVTLPAAATAVRAHHRPDAIADGSANSVVPVGATVCPNGVDSSSTTPPTTAPPTIAPPTTGPPTTAPPTTAPPTTAPPSTAPPSTAPPSTAPVRATTPSVAVLAETTVVGATSGASPTTAPGTGALATTGSGSEPIGGVALILLGVGVLTLGWRAQQITRRN